MRPVFLICKDCGTVAEAEAEAVTAALSAAAAAQGFAVDRSTVEALGTCPACRGAA